MTNTITKLLRIGVFTLTLGGVAVSQADTQNEKGDAGHMKGMEEIFDCKKDKWVGTYDGAGGADILCFYWTGGPMTVTCVGKSNPAMDTAMMCFDESGKCVWIEDSEVAAMETRTSTQPAGKYYLCCGPWDMWCYPTMTAYTTGGYAESYCGTVDGASGDSIEGEGAAGPFFACEWTGEEDTYAPGDTYEICIVGYEHPGVPFQQDAQAGEKAGKTKSGGQVKVMSTRKKAKFFCACVNGSDKRGATGVQMRGVSKKKFKQKYIDIATGENLTADLRGTDFCKNYDPGFKQNIKCIMKPKGRFKKMDNVKSKCIIQCDHDGGETTDSKKVTFYANLKKKS